jgi:hypothetical protein
MVSLLLELLQGVGIALIMLIGPCIAATLLLRRKRMVRKQRKSPLTENLLRPPGHHLLLQIEAVRDEIDEYMMRLMFIPTVFTAFYFSRLFFDRLSSTRIGLAVIVAIAVVGVITQSTLKMLKDAKKLDGLKAGYDAEMAVGQELDQLMRKGAWVFHDIEADGFNIDHVVVAPQGVFAVETKGYTKPTEGDGKANARVVFDGQRLSFPHFGTSQPIEQAERQARWLAEWLTKATGASAKVLPVVALPGWYVERKGTGTVQVLSGKELQAHLLTNRRAQPVPEQHLQQIAYQLEQRCRNIEPRYAK